MSTYDGNVSDQQKSMYGRFSTKELGPIATLM